MLAITRSDQLRFLGLRNAIDNGQLTVEEATNQFEMERQRVIKEFKQRLEQELGEHKTIA